MYLIASIKDDTLTVFDFSNKIVVDDLKREEVEFEGSATGNGIVVHSKDHLMLAAKVMAKRVNDSDNILVLRIVETDEQRAKLANDIKVAHLKWYESKPEVQFTLGLVFEEGREVSQTYPQGVKQNYAKAAEFYRKAADQGLAKAQYKLGWLYESGQGVPQDYAEVVKWYRKAAEQGLAEAQNDLGVMYLKGRGVQQNDVEAAKWFRKAADQGDVEAQATIGKMFDVGLGVSQDYAEAANWYRKAADVGHAKAQNALGNLYQKGQGLPQDHAEAVKWWRKAADQGNVDAQASLSMPEKYAAGADFSTNGYTDPALMKEIYEGKFDSQSVPPAPTYAQEFMSMFVHGEQEECKHLVSPSSFAKITAIGTKRMVQDLIPGLNKPTLDMPQQHPQKLEDFFTQGWNMGSATMGRANQLTQRADSDAQLFYDRHGCQSEIEQRFFRNLNSWIDLL